ncbi:hypothetical protein COU59_03765 [Candidatus Pacearchaeota archaeon CG10_big_fil_rev_8_21_14_0_10_34_12]|nr:MAG: hypothetical protein COU59_03765 [Candidatus Pacearchaeota archaeon CG10_big_fil_rev_8_21_14_0_10_34_12]
MRDILKNKKADISITILVLGVVTLCILTILSFISSNNGVKNDFVGPGLIETVNAVALENNFMDSKDFTSEIKGGFSKVNVMKTSDGSEKKTIITVEDGVIIGDFVTKTKTITFKYPFYKSENKNIIKVKYLP